MESYDYINHVKNKGNEHSNSSNSNYFIIFYYYVCVGDYLLIWFWAGGDLTPCYKASHPNLGGSLKTTMVGAFTLQRLANSTHRGQFQRQKSQRSFEQGKCIIKND